jgi:aryl-alcohol dehydrogenase-like predicted oxidoreductase
MKTTHLGRTGLSVSRICLGTMNFGPFDAGGLVRDHGPRARRGRPVLRRGELRPPGRQRATETINWLAQGNGRREQVVLATKVYGATGDGPNDKRLSARHIRQACEDSLQRLKTDHIDLYQMHHIDRATPWDEIWQAMEQLIRAGKVLYVGSSNFAAWHIVKANCAAKERGLLGVVSEQSIYHLNNRTVELEVLPMCESEGVGVLPWSPVGGGLLGGVLKKESAGRRATDFIRGRVEVRPQIAAYEKLSDEIAVPPAQVALAWLLRQPAVTAPIVGPRDGAPRGRRPCRRCETRPRRAEELDDIFRSRRTSTRSLRVVAPNRNIGPTRSLTTTTDSTPATSATCGSTSRWS